MFSKMKIRGTALGLALIPAAQIVVQAQGQPATSDSVPAAEATSASAAAAAVAGFYRLVQVAGKPLPVLIEKELRCEEHVTAGTLTLAADSTWTLKSTRRETCGDRAKNDSETDDGRFALEGRSIRFIDDDDDDDRDRGDADIDLDDLQTATIDAKGTLTATLDDGRTTLVFRR